MAIETFTWDRQKGAQGKIEYKVRVAQFGDGYSQAVQDGLNNEVQTWPLTFEGGIGDIIPIRDFLRRHKGSKSFYWTAPGETAPFLFRAKSITLTSVGGGIYSLSVEFQQVFTL